MTFITASALTPRFDVTARPFLPNASNMLSSAYSRRWVEIAEYSDQAARDFTFASSTYFSQASPTSPVIPTTAAVYETHCSMNPQTGSTATDPYYNIWGNPVPASDGSKTQDQGSLCGAHESRPAVEPGIDASVTPYQWLTLYGGYDTIDRSPALGGGGGLFQAVNPKFYILAKGAYAQFGGKVHFTSAPGLRNFIAGLRYFHNDYTNQEIDLETALGVEETSGGNSTYHGVDAFFDADPRSNIHIFFNFSGETSKVTIQFDKKSVRVPSGPTPTVGFLITV